MRRPSLLPILAAGALCPAAAPAGAIAKQPVAPAQTYAVIGDTPYGAAQLAAFPQDIAAINADPDASLVLHLGDIKSGSTRCDTSYFELIRSHFDTFADPLVYTPGDNEWTDCHRTNNGAYEPDERLAELRRVFFDTPGQTLGGEREVVAQEAPYSENVLWRDAEVVFGTLHVVGSDNDLAPWFGDAETPEQRERRLAEYADRLAADLRWIDAIFDTAKRTQAAAVAIALQADMWDRSAIEDDAVSGYAPLVEALAKRARTFHKPVLLLNGDSHLYYSDRPLADPDAESSRVYGIRKAVPNLLRVTVQGSTNVPHEWLKLHIDPGTPEVFRWENVAFGT